MTIALLAAMRARRAEGALRAGADGPMRPIAQELDGNPEPRARDQEARRSGVLDDLERTADDLAHDLKDLLTAITGRTELLIASLDEAHPGRPDAYEIRRLALSGARIGKPLRATEPASAYAPSIARPVAALVLVVEDEPRIRELIKVVLSRGGHDVVAVAGPHEGLAVLNRQPAVELMLVDVVMPDMNGYDLAVQARALVPGLRVVFMSGFTRDLTRHPTRDRFLAKPFAIQSLHDVVQQALSDP
jgi:CheY-like chemotaxis protein